MNFAMLPWQPPKKSEAGEYQPVHIHSLAEAARHFLLGTGLDANAFCKGQIHRCASYEAAVHFFERDMELT